MIKVLVVDDSALVRQLLTSILDADPGIQIVGTAVDPYQAREKIKKLSPDVLTLDIEMPRMDGVTFLGNLMRLRPMPVVMVSTLTEQGADVTLQALEMGAVDFVSKPKLDVAQQLPDYAEEIILKVKTAARAKVQVLERRVAKAPLTASDKLSADAVLARSGGKSHFRTTDRIIGIGSSTGGTEAIKDVLRDLPPDLPGIVISQHIPEAFSAAFASRVNGITQLTVCEAQNGQQILPGHVYISPGNRHLLVRRDGARYICSLNDGPPVNRHKPSVDVMFRSLAQNAGPNAIAVMLTGMGDDGAEGMGEMRQAGAPTIAQDEKSSVVWGMPGEAVKRGYVEVVLPLQKIGMRLTELCKQ
ncbi:protein-glutamate methylesterase/protein-glutamine glutaminase [endosymbiont of Riftia pachyptila]|uniref:Protein-glutamate methylesterase/protein-glutamine glutaminase n=1 Tax=endosymbiont of Riftia pachyptila (vent Ph05) TaxID=1048808 RepID=G2D9C4_9GAMM|nr:chemotaxis response regulator protein-glutamate methylesterase [endosymbiont of Riftia pachyptila]EGV52837.1 chemotaxis response regulator protein-glutamate methylesterase [endosymbiont of Riftia pachyptila (vent Ph05)]